MFYICICNFCSIFGFVIFYCNFLRFIFIYLMLTMWRERQIQHRHKIGFNKQKQFRVKHMFHNNIQNRRVNEGTTDNDLISYSYVKMYVDKLKHWIIRILKPTFLIFLPTIFKYILVVCDYSRWGEEPLNFGGRWEGDIQRWYYGASHYAVFWFCSCSCSLFFVKQTNQHHLHLQLFRYWIASYMH